MSVIKDDKFITDLGKIIANSDINTSEKKVAKAQYDKSYNATILGINQDFTDDVTEEEQEELIKKYSIPEVPDKDNYYTFKINGSYYVKSSNTDFNLYENVKIRIPNGSWDNMYIEVQRDTVGNTDTSAKWYVGIEAPTEDIKDGDYWVRLHWRTVVYDADGSYNPHKAPSKSIRDVFKWNESESKWIEEYSCVGQIIQETDDYKGDYKQNTPYDIEDTNTRTAELFNFYERDIEESIDPSARLGDRSHSEGYQSYAYNFAGHAEGEESRAWGRGSHAEGGGITGNSMTYTCEDGNIVYVPSNSPDETATNAHAESGGQACGDYSHAESGGIADGHNSHAERGGQACGDYSHAGGVGTITQGYSQTVVGKYNIAEGSGESADDPVFIVGCGKNNSNRKNAIVVASGTGDTTFGGNIIIEGSIINSEGESFIDIEGGKGILVSNSGKKTVISADIDGKTITLDENNKLSAKTGSTYTAGGGISIADDKISVKYDDETLEILSDGRLRALGNIVIIQEKDMSHLLHKYTEVKYIAGNKAVYGGVGNPIIIQGYEAKYGAGVSDAITDPIIYTSAVLNSFADGAVTEYKIQAVEKDSTPGKRTFTIKVNGEVKYTATTYNDTVMGFVINYRHIYSETSINAPYGYAYLEIYAVYVTSNGSITASFVSEPSRKNYAFASEAEYNAAVGLTYEPQELTQVIDTVTEV